MTFWAIIVPDIGATLKMLIPVGPEVAASSVSWPVPELLLPTKTLSFMFTGGAGEGAHAWLCIVMPGNPLSSSTLLMTTFPASVVPGKGAKIPTPAPAPGTSYPLRFTTFFEIVLSVTPYGNPAVGITDVAGPCEASVIPQSNGLSCTQFSLIRFAWFGPVSSVIRIPPELYALSLR